MTRMSAAGEAVVRKRIKAPPAPVASPRRPARSGRRAQPAQLKFRAARRRGIPRSRRRWRRDAGAGDPAKTNTDPALKCWIR
jgi:hypothetical protein